MSTKIRLYFSSSLDLELLEKGVAIYSTRLLGEVVFWEGNKWSGTHIAIIDTGAPVSLVPLDIWKSSDVKLLASTKISGLVPKRECSIEVGVGEISFKLVDKSNVTPKMEAKAYFALTNQIPLILGFEGLLKNYDVCFSCTKNEAFINID